MGRPFGSKDTKPRKVRAPESYGRVLSDEERARRRAWGATVRARLAPPSRPLIRETVEGGPVVPFGCVLVPLQNGMVAILDASDAHIADGRYWQAYPRFGLFYARTFMQGSDGKWRVTYLHRLIIPGVPLVDHFDGNTLNNRRANLRPATRTENSRNRKRPSNNKTGFVGVQPSPKSPSKFLAIIQLQSLGTFSTAEAAARAYDAEARKRYGEFASLNFPLHGERGA